MNIKTVLMVTIVLLSMVMIGSGAAPTVTTDESNYSYYSDTSDVNPNNYTFSESSGWYHVVSTFWDTMRKINNEQYSIKRYGSIIIEDGVTNTTFSGIENTFKKNYVHKLSNVVGGDKHKYESSNVKRTFSGYQIDNGTHHIYYEYNTIETCTINKKFNSDEVKTETIEYYTENREWVE